MEKHLIASRQQWLDLRQQDVTASAAGALVCEHDHETPFSLYTEKLGITPPEKRSSGAMERGLQIETLAYRLLKAKHRRLTPRWNGRPGRIPGCTYYRDPDTRMGATPDVLALCAERGPGVIQVKSVQGNVFRDKWLVPDTREIDPPMWVVMQALVEAAVTGAAWAAIAVCTVEWDITVQLIDVPLHQGALDELRRQVAEFWRRIAALEPYEPIYERDGDIIRAIYAQHVDDKVAELPDDPALVALVHKKRELSAAKTAADKTARELDGELKAINARLLATMGDAEYGRFADGVVLQARTIHCAERVQSAYSYRPVKIVTKR